MRTKFLLHLLTALGFVFLSYNAEAQEIERFCVTYTDSAKSSNVSIKSQMGENIRKLSAKKLPPLQISSRKGYIQVACENAGVLSTAILRCLKLAIDSWEDKLSIRHPITFYASFPDNMPSSVAISTTVCYSRKSRFESLPNNLYKQGLPDEYKEYVIYDTLKVNPQIDWDSSWPSDGYQEGSVSLTTAFLRHIGHILGFGTSVVNRSGGLGFTVNQACSPFDKLLTNGETYLSDTKKIATSQDIENFFTKPLTLQTSASDYSLYNEGSFVQGKSGSYFSLGHDNLMEYPLQDESKLLSINTETWNVMHDLGWTVSPHDIEIECDSADVLGYGSVYRTLNFKAKSVSDGSLQSATWRYQVLDTITRTYKNESSATGTSFTVTPTLEPSSVDPYAFQQARVCCTVAGKEYTLPLSLDAMPLIKDVKIFNRKDLGNNRCSFDILVIQGGSTTGWVYVSDGTGSSQSYKITDDTIHVSSAKSGYYLSVEINLENEYGFATRYIENIFNEKKTAPAEDPSFVQISVNGEITDSAEPCLHDGDEVSLSLIDATKNWSIKEIRWRVFLKTTDGTEQGYILSDDKSCSFTVTHGLFGCSFARTKDGERYNTGGFTWKDLNMVLADSCRFVCDAIVKTAGGNEWYQMESKNVRFDVLPDSPSITVLDSWTDKEIGYGPMVKIKVETSNFDQGAIYIGQDYDGLPPYKHTDFDSSSDFEFTIDVGYWTNTIYCWVANAYGQSGSEQVKASTNGIAQTFDQGCTLYVENNVLHVQSESPVDVEVFTIDGQQTGRCLSTTHYAQQLAPGLHLAKTRDCRTKSVSVRKIVVK